MWSESKEESTRLSSAVPTDKTRGNGHKLNHKKFCLNKRKHLLIMRVVKHGKRLAREVVESPSMEVLKT